MSRLMAVIQLTFRESLAKRTFMAFFGISTIVNLLFIFGLNLDIVDGADSYITLFGNEIDEVFHIEDIIYNAEGVIAAALYTVGLFFALFATSSLIPSMLERGNIDLMISKPLSRWQILTGRYLGATAIVSFNIYYMIIFAWIVFSIKSGIWNFEFLLSGIMIIVIFSILYALMALLSVTIRSGPFALMITYFLVFVSHLLIQRDQIYALLTSKYYGYLLDGLYYFLPKVFEIQAITTNIVRHQEIGSLLPIWTSLGFGLLMFVSANLIFSRKNY